ncbi:MAG: hypothetical protein ACLP8S_14245 [Solirubrobacteraceae bacterium]
MVAAGHDSSIAHLQPFFERLIARDASGRSWLPALLQATPNGHRRLGDLLGDQGSLIATGTVRTANGRLGCFEYTAAAPRELLAWFIDHPEALVWPERSELSHETTRLRRALLRDDPPGSQVRAQERARELLATRSYLSREWWRFEDVLRPGCVLITDRLVVTVAEPGSESLGPANDWYPARAPLVRAIEAAKGLADGRRWASLLLSEEPLAEGEPEHLDRVLAASTPHLIDAQRDELRAAYLGNLTWRDAGAAVGLAHGNSAAIRI